MSMFYRWKDVCLIVLATVGIVLLGHFWITDRLGVLRAVYPLEAFLAGQSVRCSEGAPPWLHELIDHALKHQRSLSNQVAYRGPDGQSHHCENGWLDTPLLSPTISTDTRFRFASLTKLLTVDTVMAYVASGQLSLDDRLIDRFPLTLPLADDRIAGITLEQLLRHRGGIDRLRRPDPMLTDNEKPWCPGNVIELSKLKLDFDPNTRFAYANLGYCLLGVVLEHVSGKPFRELMEERYGLAEKGLRFIDGPYLEDEVRYDFRNSNFYTEHYYQHFDFPALSSSAGLSGSALGLMKVLSAMPLRQPKNLLSPAPYVADCDKGRYEGCYGYAVMPYRSRNSPLTLYVQSGFLVGTASKAVFDSEGGITIWLGSGMSLKPLSASAVFVETLNGLLIQHYGLEY